MCRRGTRRLSPLIAIYKIRPTINKNALGIMCELERQWCDMGVLAIGRRWGLADIHHNMALTRNKFLIAAGSCVLKSFRIFWLQFFGGIYQRLFTLCAAVEDTELTVRKAIKINR